MEESMSVRWLMQMAESNVKHIPDQIICEDIELLDHIEGEIIITFQGRTKNNIHSVSMFMV